MTGKISIGEVLRGTYSTYRSNFVTLSLTIIVIMAVPMVLFEMFLMPHISNPVKMEQAFSDPALLVQIIGLYFLFIIAYFAATLGSAFGSVEAQEGTRSTIVKCLSAGFRGTFPMLVISVLLVLLTFIPPVAFGAVSVLIFSGPLATSLVPAFAILAGILLVFYISVIWSPVMAVVAFEKSGPIAALKRAPQLTKGNRWRLLALTLIWIVLIGGLSLLTGPISALVAGNELSILEPKPIGFGDARAIMGSTVMYLISVVVYVLGGVFPAAVFFNLREAREGMTPNRAASVFE